MALVIEHVAAPGRTRGTPLIVVELVVASHAIGGPHGRDRSPTMAFSGAVKTLTFSVDVKTAGSSSWHDASDTIIAPGDLRHARGDPGPHTGPSPARGPGPATTASTNLRASGCQSGRFQPALIRRGFQADVGTRAAVTPMRTGGCGW